MLYNSFPRHREIVEKGPDLYTAFRKHLPSQDLSKQPCTVSGVNMGNNAG